MTKFLKLFAQHAEYQQYVEGDNMELPNVSLCKQENEVHYNPMPETRVIATFFVSDASKKTQVIGMDADDVPGLYYEKIECDGIDITNDVPTDYGNDHCKYPLTEGYHTIKYTLTNVEDMANDTTGSAPFMGCDRLVDIQLPSTLKTISWNCFRNCTSLTSITIPKNVSELDWQCFYGCTSLQHVISLPIVPPTYKGSGGFPYWFCSNYLPSPNGTILPSLQDITVPSQSLEDYKAEKYWSVFQNLIKA